MICESCKSTSLGGTPTYFTKRDFTISAFPDIDEVELHTVCKNCFSKMRTKWDSYFPYFESLKEKGSTKYLERVKGLRIEMERMKNE
jgi:hypothetical protein